METYKPDSKGIPTIKKTVPGVLDYSFDWSAWLAGDTITAHQVTAAPGVTLDSDLRTGNVVTAWLSGGRDGGTYWVRCRVTTAAGRTDERTIQVAVVAAR